MSKYPINDLPIVKRADGTIDVIPNDCNITTVEAEYDRAMAYKPRCFGQRTPESNCKYCNWPFECQNKTDKNFNVCKDEGCGNIIWGVTEPTTCEFCQKRNQREKKIEDNPEFGLVCSDRDDWKFDSKNCKGCEYGGEYPNISCHDYMLYLIRTVPALNEIYGQK